MNPCLCDPQKATDFEFAYCSKHQQTDAVYMSHDDEEGGRAIPQRCSLLCKANGVQEEQIISGECV
jgi:hypothetical protein